VWVEVEPKSGREGQEEKEGALNGLREYQKYDGGNLGELPWIGTFYHDNCHMFHPGHRRYRVTDNGSGSSVGTNREVRSIHLSFQSKSNIFYPGNHSTWDYFQLGGSSLSF
jgi:hypothetical protein